MHVFLVSVTGKLLVNGLGMGGRFSITSCLTPRLLQRYAGDSYTGLKIYSSLIRPRVCVVASYVVQSWKARQRFWLRSWKCDLFIKMYVPVRECRWALEALVLLNKVVQVWLPGQRWRDARKGSNNPHCKTKTWDESLILEIKRTLQERYGWLDMKNR